MTLEQEYLARSGDDKLGAAVALALDLMRDDPANFKRGYTLENAAWAAADMFGLDRHAIQTAVIRTQAEEE